MTGVLRRDVMRVLDFEAIDVYSAKRGGAFLQGMVTRQTARLTVYAYIVREPDS